MKDGKWRRWLIVAAIFAALFFVFGGGYNSGGVFVVPLIAHFGWSHAQVSLLQTTLSLSSGLFVPLVGWLLDRYEAKFIIGAGAAITGIGFLLAAAAPTFVPMVLAYTLAGWGIAASTLIPASFVVANWFGQRRGLALAFAMSGTSLGGMVMTFIASQTIMTSGWRMAYVVLAIPMLVIVVPLVFTFVRTNPKGASQSSVADVDRRLGGLDVKQALLGRSFWLIAVAQLLFTITITGVNLHVVPYLTGAGFTPAGAALVLSIILGLAAAGKLATGLLADRIGARMTLTMVLAVMAIALVVLVSVPGQLLAVFVVLYGLSWGAPTVLFPLALAEISGLKRYGSLLGLLGITTKVGGTIGPVLTGATYDLNHSYGVAFCLFAVALTVGALATLASAPALRAVPEPISLPGDP